ncbi:MAG: hypothetical protein QOH86_106 [Sphingomonadales bacterium]|jgi:Gpi18-like mannosyltransferase|nr:hypothetical protein [Sphingomonadales bacterium]
MQGLDAPAGIGSANRALEEAPMSRRAPSDHRRIPLEKLQWLLLPAASLAVAAALLTTVVSSDMTTFLIPWMTAVRSGGLGSLSAEFSNYSPPYVYLLYLAGPLVPLTGAVAAIKLISLPFVVLASAAMYDIVLQACGDKARAFAAACATWVLPTLLANAFWWGQADVIYTAFLLWFVAFAGRGRPAAAAVLFGLALAFKAQAVLLAPALLYLVLDRRMAAWQLLLVPAVYAAMMVPAVLAGRPWLECLTVYGRQFEAYRLLRVTAPNIWQLAARFVSYETGLAIGVVLGSAAAAGIVLAGLRLKAVPHAFLLIAALSSALLPFVLPKAHERFFFPAELLTLALAFARPRYWGAAALLQIGGLLAYTDFLGRVRGASLWAAGPIALGLGILVVALREAYRWEIGAKH